MIECEVTQVDVGKRSLPKLLAEGGKRFQDHADELPLIGSWISDTSSIPDDDDMANSATGCRHPTATSQFGFAGVSGLFEKLPRGGRHDFFA